MILLICFILSYIVEISSTQICNNTHGSLILPKEKSFLTKVTENNHTQLFVDKQEQLAFMCQNEQGFNELQLFGSSNDVIQINNFEDDLPIAARKKYTVTCESVCNVTVILPKIVQSSRCNVNETLGNLNCKFSFNQRYDAKYKADITYWILEYGDPPYHVRKFKQCTELDKGSEVIISGINNGEHNTNSIKCKLDKPDGSNSVILKIRRELKNNCHVTSPTLCPYPPVIKENYLMYKFTPADLLLLKPTKFPWVILFITPILLIFLVILSICWYKRCEKNTHQVVFTA